MWCYLQGPPIFLMQHWKAGSGLGTRLIETTFAQPLKLWTHRTTSDQTRLSPSLCEINFMYERKMNRRIGGEPERFWSCYDTDDFSWISIISGRGLHLQSKPNVINVPTSIKYSKLPPLSLYFPHIKWTWGGGESGSRLRGHVISTLSSLGTCKLRFSLYSSASIHACLTETNNHSVSGGHFATFKYWKCTCNYPRRRLEALTQGWVIFKCSDHRPS